MADNNIFQKFEERAIRKRNASKGVWRMDEKAIQYAEKNEIDYLYVDIDTGEVMQFGRLRDKSKYEKRWKDMFPYRNMKSMTLDEYKNK